MKLDIIFDTEQSQDDKSRMDNAADTMWNMRSLSTNFYPKIMQTSKDTDTIVITSDGVVKGNLGRQEFYTTIKKML